jgi:CCR4-NOT transcription complex subunit 1
MAIERAVVEIISPVVDRSVTIAVMTAQELVAKDFALEGDAETVRRAAHLAVAGLAQSLALVTAREPLRLAVTNNLRALLAGQLEPAALEQVVALLVGDNLDLCCQVVERAAGDRAQREADERLAGAYAARARAKAAGQPFADAERLAGRFPAALPAALRPRPGALTPQQQRVYRDFASIPRTAAAAAQSAAAAAAAAAGGRPALPGEPGAEAGGAPGGAADAATASLRVRFVSWLQRLDAAVAQNPAAALAALPDGHEAKAVVAEVASLPAGEAQAADVARTVFAKLCQGAPGARLHFTAYAAALAVLRDAAGLRSLPADAAGWLAAALDEVRGARDAGEALARAGLLAPAALDAPLAARLEGGRHQPAAELLLGLLQSCVLGPEPNPLSAADLPRSLDALSRLAARVSGGQAVVALVEEARRTSAARAGGAPPPGALGAAAPAAPKAPADPPALVDAVMKAFDRWARLLDDAPSERVHAGFVQELRDAGLLGADDATERFVRVMATLAVQHCLRSEAYQQALPPAERPPAGTLSFVAVDAFVRLMACLVTQHGGGPPLFARVAGVVAALLRREADERGAHFNGRPFFRIVVGFLAELPTSEPGDEAGAAYLAAIAGLLYATRPARCPAFALPWLQLLAERRFMPRMLVPPAARGWPLYLQLLLADLAFLEPHLRAGAFPEAVRALYKGTLRLLLVLLHDFPEFLCQFHFRLCDAIPPGCVQLRNLALSAFPRAMRLPDPFTPDLKVDLLPEAAAAPLFSPATEALLPPALRADVDAILARAAPPGAAAALPQRLLLPPAEAAAAGSRFNAPLVNALAFYVGIRAVEAAPAPPGGPPATAGTPAFEVYTALLRGVDAEGRYLLLNALANQLRYPNAHTQYFSCAVLALFEGAADEGLKEQVTRVLLERLVCNRPHPWGLLITFIELIKNPRFRFWSHAFTRSAPEIERLFESVARSCGAKTGEEAPPAAAQVAA